MDELSAHGRWGRRVLMVFAATSALVPAWGWALAHTLLIVIDALALGFIHRRRDDVLLAALCWGVAVALLGFGAGQLSGGDLFLYMSLAGQALFVHGPLVLIGAALLAEGRLRAAMAGGALLIALVGVDAYLIEPRWIEASEYDLVIPDAPRPLTIAVLADIQTDGLTAHEHRALDLAMEANPDIILFPGDLVHVLEREAYLAIADELRGALVAHGVSAPLGVYAVSGNTDPTGTWRRVFEGVGEAVDQGIVHFEPEPGVHVTALPFRTGFDTELRLPDRDGLHIVLAHAPDFSLGEVGADLLVAGHVHGGQVQVPFVGPLITFSQVPRDWAAGHTEIHPGTHLLVSRGVGMERHNAPRLRFNCRPEVMILRVRPS